jgi:pimeloyl-ACP methyl ester carboxylesterase
MPYVTSADGVSVWYDTVGRGEPLVLIGGCGLASNQWEFMLPILRDQFQVVLFDPRGAGRAERPEAGVTVEQWTDDLKRVLDALEIEKAYLFGAGDGSYIVIRFAVKYPGRAAAIAHGGMHKPTDTSLKVAKIGAKICAEFGIGNGSPGAHFLVRLLGIPAEFEQWQARRFEKNLSPESWSAVQAALERDLSEDLPKIAAPQLIVIGDNGLMGKGSEAGSGWKAVQQACPFVEVAAIADATEPYAVITHPGEVFRKLIRFFAKHPIATRTGT